MAKKQHSYYGFVTLSSSNPPLRVSVRLDQNGVKVTGGYGGWSAQARPRRVALTQFDGKAPFELTLEVLFDGYSDNESQEQKIVLLERMALPPRAGASPPIIKTSGRIPHTDLSWVVSNITWGDAIRNSLGRRVRQFATITLLQYVSSDLLQLQPAAVRAREKNNTLSTLPGRTVTYTVKKGDTLPGIARRLYGSMARWHDLASANGIRDPATIKVGQVLRVP